MPPVADAEEVVFPQDGGCFGCSRENAAGLAMRFRRQGEEVHARYTVADRFHGAPGVVHGGIVATLLDEISCATAVAVEDRFVVTGELSIRFERPVPVETELALEARVIDKSHPKYFVIEATIHDGEHRLARSSGKFFLKDRAAGAVP